ncbi:MAG: FKBP-type peptidyl-prolyl cis-trans isomerase [Muribaculaceae bacterium]|nr:FKBP-type peptidyl-prolyl cis-trans isomerase [Muribaculaceae bacterium]
MRRILMTAAATVAVALGATAAESQPVDSLSVALGSVIGEQLRQRVDNLASIVGPFDVDVFVSTVSDVLHARPTAFTPEQADAWIDAYVARTRPADDLPEVYTPESQQEFLTRMAATPGAVTTPSGLVFIVETEGEGPMPGPADKVSVMYSGRLYDGRLFDATGSPIKFGVSELTPGFAEGLQMMRPGGRYRMIIPASGAYGPQGISGIIPGNAALDFTVDLIGVERNK